ncbi:hypothetical protein C4M97_02520 [Mycoplasmopsis pullorum]|uniref:OppA family ABC transporter substrate-binding lipoprotein n=1 Tax=Mycoplasmopsis pullorum TaxID=48003 RepID=UPI00111B1BD9|nr:hypothetical protein [Mycoplasmopsis pullorum]TNK81944.1 hypothetical protein C4M94_02510 [Mycoplasmopsis pullorum]TNK82704.1 hypothetical protein C4M80_02635 [Mycoplasmopsis pullorum]TNK84646.1 hypothetical protein C4M81_01625 [Mycoplasmopsis pullorum]TNK84880.1 hypothetical protein C4M92_02750 [Mycoplasmopsis pullorum]TNK85620.1 hypothetical protein C4M85_02710 [Mycoplasmopsis pullorum]
MKLKKIWCLPLASIPFAATVSCVYTGDYVSYHEYSKMYNAANNLIENDFKFNQNKYLENEIDNLNFEPIFKYHFDDKMTYDYLNNYVKNPTKKYLKFSLARSILIKFSNQTQFIYDNDEYDTNNIVPDINSGYSKSIYSVDSVEKNSINNSFFIKNLAKAESVVINLNPINYVDSDGNLSAFELVGDDLFVSFNSPINKEYKEKIIEKYGIEIETSDNSVQISSSKFKLADFIFEELLKNTIFNPISTQYLKSKNISIEQYNPKLSEKLFLTPYLLHENSIDKQVYIKNQFYVNSDFVQKANNLTKITLKFQNLPIDNETFRIQLFRGYRQRLVSEAKLNVFNSLQQREIINNASAYGLQNDNSIIYNQSKMNYFYNSTLNPNLENDFNKNYLNLVYGGIQNENSSEYFYANLESYLFRLYLNEIVNPYYFAQLLNQNDIIKNSAYPYAQFFKKVDQSNYKNVIDALLWVDSYNISDLNLTKTIQNITLNDKNNSLSFEHLFDFKVKLSSQNFEFIRQNLEDLLDRFYSEHKLNAQMDKISWTLPIFQDQSELLINAYQKLKEFYNFVDSRLDFNFKFVGSDYLTKYNSTYKYEAKIYSNNKISNYFVRLLSQKDFQRALVSNHAIFMYPKLNKFIEWFKQNNDYENQIDQYLSNLSTYDQIELINAFSALDLTPLTHQSVININSFDQEIVQNYYQKPLSDTNYVNFEDIKIIR